MKREALSHPVAIAGVVVTTTSAVLFITLVIAGLTGLLGNPYAGLVVFVAIPAFFVIGLLLIPVGVWLWRRKQRLHPDAVVEWPVVDFRRPRVRRTVLLVTALTAVNFMIILLAGYGSLHWMESPTFCGQVCHTPMHPQFTAWHDGVHARIACVACHIGEGPAAFVHAKLAGVRQLVQVAGDSYPRPIPPNAEMPPGARAQTCRECHQPEHAVGDRIRVIREYADDEANAETITVMQMHVNATPSSAHAIHWHADSDVRVEYVSTDEDRQTIPYVKVTDAKGNATEYLAADATDQTIGAGRRRVMDCGDCHNAVGHPIAPTAEEAVDQAIAVGHVSRGLPYVRREGVRLVKATYPSEGDAARAIDQGLTGFYKSRGGSTDQEALKRAVSAFQDLYRSNVFPTMKVTWGSYPDNKGHITSNGCFRCHDDSHKAKDGKTISADCEYCHRQLETPSSQS